MKETTLPNGLKRFQYKPFTIEEAARLGFSLYVADRTTDLDRVALLARSAHEVERIRRMERAAVAGVDYPETFLEKALDVLNFPQVTIPMVVVLVVAAVVSVLNW